MARKREKMAGGEGFVEPLGARWKFRRIHRKGAKSAKISSTNGHESFGKELFRQN